MGVNQIYQWAVTSDANTMSDTAYQVAVSSGGSLVGGVVSGRASSLQANKTWRQALAPASGLAQFLADTLDVTITDLDTPATFSARITQAIETLAEANCLQLEDKTTQTVSGEVEFESDIHLKTSGSGATPQVYYDRNGIPAFSTGVDGNGNLFISRYDLTNAGAWLGEPISVNGETGAITINSPIIVPGVSDWTAYQAVGAKDADGRYLRLSGSAQTSDASTTFTGGLTGDSTYVGTLSALPGSVDITVESGLRMGLKTLYCNTLAPDGDSDLKVTTNFRMGSQTLYCNDIQPDGSTTRTIGGNTDIDNLWQFSERPEVSGTEVALTSDFSNGSTGSSGYYIRVGNTLIQQFETAGITSTAQWITFPVEFSGTPAPPVGNVYGSGDQDTQVYGATSSGCYVKCPSGSQTQGQPVSIIVIGPVS